MVKALFESVSISVVGLAMIGSSTFTATNSGGSSLNLTGNDISYPQCHGKLSSGQAFGIVGVNDGLANNFNPCFSTELAWAGKSTGAATQPPVALYVNTGNPGDVTPVVADWPKTSVAADPYPACAGADDTGCSWEYGYERANVDVAQVPAGKYLWWLDVETANSWTSSQANNQADLEGMVYAFTKANTSSTVGVYSTSAQWSQVAGTVSSSNASLYNMTEWRPGASTENAAKSNCNLPLLTGGGKISVTQYTSKNLDYDWSCL
jgi:hypothetical protein